jgi:hypothetical protein
MGRTGRPNLIHYAIGDSACPAPSRMLRGEPPAAGPMNRVLGIQYLDPWRACMLRQLCLPLRRRVCEECGL